MVSYKPSKPGFLYRKLFLVYLLVSLLSFLGLADAKDKQPKAPKKKDAAIEGTKDGSGGNAQVAEFYAFSRAFLKIMQANPALDPEISLIKLEATVQALKVKQVPGPLILRGDKVDAINYASVVEVHLDAQSWENRDTEKKYLVVIHEILGLLENEDPQYRRSQKLFTLTYPMLNQYLENVSSSQETFKTCKNQFFYWLNPKLTPESKLQLTNQFCDSSKADFALIHDCLESAWYWIDPSTTYDHRYAVVTETCKDVRARDLTAKTCLEFFWKKYPEIVNDDERRLHAAKVCKEGLYKGMKLENF